MTCEHPGCHMHTCARSRWCLTHLDAGHACEVKRRRSRVRKKSQRKRQRVYSRSHGLCALCGGALRWRDMTVDHIVPLAHGGTWEDDNLQAAHLQCNLKKADSLPSPTPFGQRLLSVFAGVAS